MNALMPYAVSHGRHHSPKQRLTQALERYEFVLIFVMPLRDGPTTVAEKVFNGLNQVTLKEAYQKGLL
jgi:hypothetical protein